MASATQNRSTQTQQAAASGSPPDQTAAADPARKPYAGLRVHYWETDAAGRLVALPADLIQLNPSGERWNLNVLRLGRLVAKFDAVLSPTPRAGCWSFIPEG